jgi:hypothetical protein
MNYKTVDLIERYNFDTSSSSSDFVYKSYDCFIQL